MELPFAVESPERVAESTSQLIDLVAASTESVVGSPSFEQCRAQVQSTNRSRGGIGTRGSSTKGTSTRGNSRGVMRGPPKVPPKLSPIMDYREQTTKRGTRGREDFSSQRKPESQSGTDPIDLTYVNVCETDADEVDILFDGGDEISEEKEEETAGDVLSVLLSGNAQHANNEAFVSLCENANKAAFQATEAKKQGHLQGALNYHTKAAKLFRDAAVVVIERNPSLANSLLLLSQTQAKSALSLKRVVKLGPSGPLEQKDKGGNSQKDRIREAVRGALVTRNEEDISDSAFLGRALSSPDSVFVGQSSADEPRSDEKREPISPQGARQNPVDDMMELERELRDMDMALELGNSIASLDARTQNRLKNSMVDGSFMVVPPGSNSFLSSTNQQASNTRNAENPGSGTAGVRARANRVQNMQASTAGAAAARSIPAHSTPTGTPASQKSAGLGLESSWWGNSSTTSQALASSITSLGGSRGNGGAGDLQEGGGQPANTKQLMRLMDALKTLGDENASLLREVEDAEAARMEAKAAKEQMKKFQAEYSKRFEALKGALEKFRKRYPEQNEREDNPVTNSDFVRSQSHSEQLQRQEQMIRKLNADLKKEKEESKKKDAALRKYESFYREVKARSAQKAAQRQKEAGQHRQQHSRPMQSTRGLR